MRARVALALSAALGASCAPDELPPFGEVVLHVDTDAPLRPPPGTAPAPDDPLPLFDRLRVDVADPSGAACPGCTREFDLHSGPELPSFGVRLPPGELGFTARVRLFRSVPGEIEPRPDSSIDVTVALPAVSEEGTIEAAIVLPTDAIASPIGSADAPVQLEPGPPGPNRQGTWPGARRVACAGQPTQGEVCVRGGAYWMGQPVVSPGAHPMGLVTERRVVVVSPFWVDRTEVTVAAARPFLAGLSPAALAGAVESWSGSVEGDDLEDWCSYSADTSRDALPINCIVWSAARDICAARGGELPTEAQFEFLAGGLVSDLYPWGRDDPECTDAVFARAGYGVYELYANGACLPPGTPGGPAPPGAGARDSVAIDGGEVVDLAGNVREWMRDRFESEESACWPTGVVVDPVCAPQKPATKERSVRGGGWASIGSQLRASTRGATDSDIRDPGLGFRCVRGASAP